MCKFKNNIALIPEYYQKVHVIIHLTHNKLMTTIPYLQQAHMTCGGVKFVLWDCNPPWKSSQRIKNQRKHKYKTNSKKSNRNLPIPTKEYLNHNKDAQEIYMQKKIPLQ